MDKVQAFSAEAIEYPLVEGQHTCLNFKISQKATPGEEKKLKDLSSKYILFILDVSGSMAGSAINTCIEVLKDMFTFLYNEVNNKNFDLITFNSTCNFIELKGKSLEDRLATIGKVTAGGGTAFIPVFQKITELITSKPDYVKTTNPATPTPQGKFGSIQDMSIMFLSDGQAESISILQPQINNLNSVFRNFTRSCEFHTLGFTKAHDSRVLNELTLAATTQSTFQFIESSKDIQAAMEAISGLMASQKLNGNLCVGDLKIPVSFEEATATGETEGKELKFFEGPIFLEIPFEKFQELKSSLKLVLQIQNTTEECSVTIKQDSNIDDKATQIKLNLLSVHQALNKITFRLTKEKVSQEEAEAINLKVNEFKKSTEDFVRDIFKLKIAVREPLFEMVEDLKGYLTTFTGLMRSNFLNQLNNEQIAKLNSMAYRNVTRKGLLKKLDKRAHKSVPIINEAFEKVRELAAQVDEQALTEKYKDLIDKIGCCVLTCQNFVESMKEEDCLCISFDISRPEVALADCTRIKIKNIFPSIISARSFMDSAKFALNLNTEASGGFNQEKQGSIVKGISSENITAALPIYICEPHWKIAGLLMKPILGWDITLDPVGYSYFQKKVIPFMLLNHAIKMLSENKTSEFNQRIYHLLMETCTQIIKDDMEPEFQGTMKEDVTKIHENYLIDGSVRTLDSVQSNYVHLSHIYCFIEMGLLPKLTKENLVTMLKYMAEEELRRQQNDWDSSQATKYLTELLNIDVEKYVKKIREQEAQEEKKEEEVKAEEPLNENEEKFEKIFLRELYKKSPDFLTQEELALIKGVKEVKEVKEVAVSKNVEEKKTNEVPTNTAAQGTSGVLEPVDIPRSEFLKGEHIGDLTGKQKEAYNEYQALYKSFYLELFRWIKFFFPDEEFNAEDYDTLEKIGIDTSAKFMCLYIQNKVHAKNADRKAAFTSKRYLSPWEEQSSVEFLQRTYRKIVMNEKVRQDKTKRTGPTGTGKAMSSGTFEIFVETGSLEVVAGILLGGLSVSDFQCLQDLFRSRSDSNLLVLEKLKLIKEREYRGVKFPYVEVIMRKRFLRKLFKTYITYYSYYEWKELWFK